MNDRVKLLLSRCVSIFVREDERIRFLPPFSDLMLETGNKDLALLPEEVSKSFQRPPFLNLPTKVCQIPRNTDCPPDKAKAANTSLL